jgi:hypothetical protein
VWDNDLDCRVEQPTLPDVYWFPTEARALAWIERQQSPLITPEEPPHRHI